jgi:hypothetical protein
MPNINENRNWQMFREFYIQLRNYIQKGMENLSRKKFKDINRKIYMLDSTVISLCLKVFDLATYRNRKGAIKLHSLLDYDGCLPSYVFMTTASESDLRHTRYMSPPAHSVIVIDCGYQSFLNNFIDIKIYRVN